MIRAFRLCRAPFASEPLDGEGARRVGGRWNPPGTPMVYAASTLSLAALECLVHFDLSEAPADFVALQIEFPEAFVERIEVARLPSHWRESPPPAELAQIGQLWVREQRSAILAVPSAIIPDETNYLVSPGHPDVSRVMVGPPRPFQFDPRLFLSDRVSAAPEPRAREVRRVPRRRRE